METGDCELVPIVRSRGVWTIEAAANEEGDVATNVVSFHFLPGVVFCSASPGPFELVTNLEVMGKHEHHDTGINPQLTVAVVIERALHEPEAIKESAGETTVIGI